MIEATPTQTHTAASTPPGVLDAAVPVASPSSPYRWPSAVRALRHAEYRLLWSGSLVSNIGTWMQNVAEAWLIYKIASDQGGPVRGPALGAAWLGIDALASGLPVVLLLPFTGVMADRFDRRWLLVMTNTTLGLTAVVLAWLTATGRLSVWHIIAAGALGGAMQAVSVPSNQSLLPALVGPEDLPNAIALNSIQFNTSRVIGPAVGGYVLTKLGPTWSFALNALSFLAVIAALSRIRKVASGIAAKEPMVRSLKAGLGYVRGRADVVTMILLVFTGAFFAAPAMSMLPALVKEVFAGNEADFSTLLSCFGGGAVLGGVLLAFRSKRTPTPWRAFPTLMGLGACEVVLGYETHFRLTMLFFFLAGVVFVGTMARLNTAILGSTPAHIRGRVSSFFVLAFSSGAPLGSLAAGWLAYHLGVQSTFRVFGAALFVLVPLLLLGAKRGGVRYDPGAGFDAPTESR